MQLSHEAITSFQKLYKTKCGVELDFKEAGVIALEELKRFSLIYKLVPVEDREIFKKINSENSDD